MQDVHVDTLLPTDLERGLVVSVVDACSDASKNQGSRVDGLEISTRHLQYQRMGTWHHCHQLRAAFDVAASFVFLRFISRYFEFPIVKMDEFEKMLAGCVDQVRGCKQERGTPRNSQGLVVGQDVQNTARCEADGDVLLRTMPDLDLWARHGKFDLAFQECFRAVSCGELTYSTCSVFAEDSLVIE